MEKESVVIREERISAEEYIDFLKRTDLGSQYPKERFEERIRILVNSVPISLAARNEEGALVGVLFGVTDFAYWLFVTDLGVDREYVRRGIGRRLLQAAHRLAGGQEGCFCDGCFTGRYPIDIPEDQGKSRFEQPIVRSEE